MSIPNATLQAMIRSYHGFALTDDELELVRPELESYLKEVEKLRELDLARRDVWPSPAGPGRGDTLMADTALVTMTIAELAPKIKAKAISPVELTEAVLAQVDRLQPALNSFITILHEQARRQAREQEAALMRGEYRGPLHGIPIGIKDNIATAGIMKRKIKRLSTDRVRPPCAPQPPSHGCARPRRARILPHHRTPSQPAQDI